MSDAATPPILDPHPALDPQPAPNVLPFQKPGAAAPARISSTEMIWGKAVLSHGYTGIPSILIQAQVRLKLNPVKMNIIVQLLDYWRSPDRKPFPSRKELAERIDITQKTVQNNIRAMEKDGLIQRIARYTCHGDPDSNVYNLDGLVKRLQEEIEPAFAEQRKKKQGIGGGPSAVHADPSFRSAAKASEMAPAPRLSPPLCAPDGG